MVSECFRYAVRILPEWMSGCVRNTHLWAAAVEKAGSTDVDKVKEAAQGVEFKAPEGLVKIEGENQHLWKPVRIGEVTGDGLIKEIWSTESTVKPDPYLKTYEWAKGLSN